MSRITRADKINKFNDMIKDIDRLKYLLNSTIYWDKLLCMPEDAIGYRAEIMGFLANEQYKKINNPDFLKIIKYFESTKAKNTFRMNATLYQFKRNYWYIKRIPVEHYREYRSLLAISEKKWEQAKRESDFHKFADCLEKIFNYYTIFAECWGYEDEPYDALLGYYEDGITTKLLDNYIKTLKPFLTETLRKINGLKNISVNRQKNPTISKERQLELSKSLMSSLGFDFNKGRIDIGTHPTILAASPLDVRIINCYKDDWKFGMFNTLHSAGKGLYQQNINPELVGTMLAEPPSFVVEEAIGRFYENVVGRSKGYWEYFVREQANVFSELSEYSSEEIFITTNEIKATPLRIDADELTFLLHILIRYEIERDVINRQISITDLPEIWENKYQEYLGVVPVDDSEGILQDIHWAAGYIGYFPTYFLGNMIAAQLASTISEKFDSVENLASRGDFKTILNWLRENIFINGSVYKSSDLIKKATGKSPSPECLIDYLRNKYSEVYNITL